MTPYDRFLALCREKGLTPSAAMIQAGLSKALSTKWKGSPDITPNGETLAKLSKFFTVPADYFISDKYEGIPSFHEPADIAMLAAAMRNMTEQQRREVIHYAEYICPHAFHTKGD